MEAVNANAIEQFRSEGANWLHFGFTPFTSLDEAYQLPSENRTVAKFIRAIARGVMYFRTEKTGSLPTIKSYLGIQSDADAGLAWDELHNTFAAEMPAELFREIFESRRLDLIAAKEWPADQPLPDVEQFVSRALLEKTLKDMNYVPTKN